MKTLYPSGSETSANTIKASPGVLSHNHVFVTGMTGSRADGTMPDDLEQQFRNAFNKIGAVLNEAGLEFGSIVEMTSYHLGIADHFDLFNSVRGEFVSSPYPAWTAIEVAGLRRPGAVVEIRVTAEIGA